MVRDCQVCRTITAWALRMRFNLVLANVFSRLARVQEAAPNPPLDHSITLARL